MKNNCFCDQSPFPVEEKNPILTSFHSSFAGIFSFPSTESVVYTFLKNFVYAGFIPSFENTTNSNTSPHQKKFGK